MPRRANRCSDRFAVAILAGCAMASPLAARADAAPAAGLEEGLRLMAAGDLEKACPAIARAVKLAGSPAVRELLALGECHEKAGHSASALAAYQQAAVVAVRHNQAAQRAQAEAAISRVEPGVRALEALPAKAAEPAPISTANPLAEPIDDPRWGRLGTAGAVIGSAGLTTLAVALGLRLKSSSDFDDAIANPAFECAREVCNAAGNEALDNAEYLGDVATATALIGATLTAAGATMVIVELAAPIVKQQSIALGLGPGMLFVSGSLP